MAQRWRSVVENARGRQVRALSRLHVAAHARKQAPPPPPRTSGPELEGFDMRDGVSGTFLRRFRNEILQQEQLMDTTSDIKRSTILPHTSDRLCTYVDLYRGQRDSEGRLLVGAPTVFVSHAWAYKIVDSLDAMIEYDEFHPNSYFWFDLFANNHHPSKAAKMTQDWLKTTFRDAISRIGTLILIVCPWDSPIPITRAWCLWEIMSAITQSNVKFRVRMPRSIINEFVAGFLSDPDRVMAALSSVQAEKADAKEPRDLEMIFEAIRSSCGFLEMNKRINDQLRTWYLQTAVVAAKDITAAQASDGEQLAQVSACVGFILADFGEYEKALLHFNTCLSIRQASAEADPVDIATLYNNIGLMHKRMDDLDQALEYLQKSLEIRLQIFGEDHPETATSFNNIGQVYDSKEDFSKALENLTRALTIQVHVFGHDHADVATSYNNVGQVYDSIGNFDQALDHLNKCLAIRLKTIGENHPDTAVSYSNIGGVYSSRKQYDQALEYYHRCLAIEITTVGENHPDTAISYGNIAVVYDHKQDFHKALEYYEKCLTAQLNTLGESHTDTVSTYGNIGMVHESLGDYPRALESYQKCLDIQLSLRPEDLTELNALRELIGACERKIAKPSSASWRSESSPSEPSPASGESESCCCCS
eukprot:m.316414 g.316414  ORF g.316414 m.316414 type:complete len:647 (-) comp55462_c0_seq8:919-2859(-)